MRVLMRAGALAGIVAVAAWGVSCGDGGTVDPNPDPTRIQATVRVDAAARSGVTVRLYAAGGSSALEARTTNANGVATFTDLDAGTYDVEVVPPENTELDEGESARKPVTATQGQTAPVRFDLVTAAGGGDVVEVRLTSNNTFDPVAVTIAPGTTVRWINDIARFHTVTPDGHSEWTSASLSAQGATFTHTFDNEGEFPYFCEPHQAQGMTGRVTVQ